MATGDSFALWHGDGGLAWIGDSGRHDRIGNSVLFT
jgi:hypothetical protein